MTKGQWEPVEDPLELEIYEAKYTQFKASITGSILRLAIVLVS
jgi:hypothetical protein